MPALIEEGFSPVSMFECVAHGSTRWVDSDPNDVDAILEKGGLKLQGDRNNWLGLTVICAKNQVEFLLVDEVPTSCIASKEIPVADLEPILKNRDWSDEAAARFNALLGPQIQTNGEAAKHIVRAIARHYTL